MNTGKRISLLDERQIESATLAVRAFKHPHRFRIVERLLRKGSMSGGEIADHFELEPGYIAEQMDILASRGYVDVDGETGCFSPNRSKIRRFSDAVSAFATKWGD